MTLFKNPFTNIIFIIFMSAVYSFIFIFTSDHIEFLGLLSHTQTLNSPFWNEWSNFIKAGNMKFIGYFIISLTVIILLFMAIKRTKNYDEYQLSILNRCFIIAGFMSILMVPVMMIMLLSDPNYAIETILLFASVQWVSVIVLYLIYVIRN